jgi:hypothetical protein
MVASVGARSPSAAPTATIARFILSERPPQYWTAEGGTQGQWMALRQRCADIGAELTRRQSLSDKQLEASPGLSFSRDEMLLCSQLPSGKAISSPTLSPSSAAPTNNAAVGHIPENPPQYWTAEGGTQGQWTAVRERCRAIVAEMTQRERLNAQRTALPPASFSHEDFLYCANLSVSFRPPVAAQTSAAPAPGGEAPTPISTPR